MRAEHNYDYPNALQMKNRLVRGQDSKIARGLNVQASQLSTMLLARSEKVYSRARRRVYNWGVFPWG